MQINVIGAGAWGCALAVHLTLLGYSPKVYSHSAPIYTFNEMMECDFLLIAVPSVRVRGVIQRIKDFISFEG